MRIWLIGLPERVFWVCMAVLLVTAFVYGIASPGTAGLASCAGCGL